MEDSREVINSNEAILLRTALTAFVEATTSVKGEFVYWDMSKLREAYKLAEEALNE